METPNAGPVRVQETRARNLYPEEFRERTEQLCRKTMDCMREVSEAQMDAFQDSMNKWSELITKTT